MKDREKNNKLIKELYTNEDRKERKNKRIMIAECTLKKMKLVDEVRKTRSKKSFS